MHVLISNNHKGFVCLTKTLNITLSIRRRVTGFVRTCLYVPCTWHERLLLRHRESWAPLVAKPLAVQKAVISSRDCH